MPVETFPALDEIGLIRAGFIQRIPGVDVRVPREEALSRLLPPHQACLAEAGVGEMTLATAGQVHGSRIARVDHSSRFPVPDADGLLTTKRNLCLGIYVADCAAVFLVDRLAHGIALVHSGKKGTELGIAPAAVEALCQATGAAPADIIAQISPCIRPPHYEIDFAADIRRQLAGSGVQSIHDSGTCTASHPDTYYSYRREKGLTGRLLAFLALAADATSSAGS